MTSKFLYFAYGSNLLAERIHLSNPTAVVKDIGYIKNFRLDCQRYSTRWHGASATIVETENSVNFRLDFQRYSTRWHGASATIVETENSVVWGVIWELDRSNLSTLDYQEGVQDNIYHVLSVNVETPNGTILNCRVYQQCTNPKEYMKLADLSMDRRPSPLYRDIILKGAQENNLPTDYIELLKTIPHNGYEGKYDIRYKQIVNIFC